ncbi:hypothetical protein AKJ51_01030 [candidate division MSBL1 archaeon SCGC-AAA382A20]|uniref:Uncharacterized protein n=1 Tax=candidate division MSBL1 archaeon SCGC-AAA382A20 TaxID=1698280 RepID=A0A133VMC0_9EURY|nr:hypothetical protein AKJ51_01030 [candidate division MSBL1 archaeon SCGC-AAA382A20]
MAAFETKQASEALGRKLERLVSYKAAGEPITPELTRWVDSLPHRILDNLAKWEIINTHRAEGGRHLKKCVDAWRKTLLAKGKTG